MMRRSAHTKAVAATNTSISIGVAPDLESKSSKANSVSKELPTILESTDDFKTSHTGTKNDKAPQKKHGWKQRVAKTVVAFCVVYLVAVLAVGESLADLGIPSTTVDVQRILNPFLVITNRGLPPAAAPYYYEDTYVHPKKMPPPKDKDNQKHDPMISWSMRTVPDDQPTYDERFNRVYQCHAPSSTSSSSKKDRLHLDPTIQSKVWFHTAIQTSLNILVMGDSVAMQLGELLQEAMDIDARTRQLLRVLYPQCRRRPPEQNDPECSYRDALHESLFWGQQQQKSIQSQPQLSSLDEEEEVDDNNENEEDTDIRRHTNIGGGGSGGWRIVNWWLRRNAGKPLPEAFGGGWDLRDSPALLRTIGRMQQHTTSNKPKVDVLVFRVSQPWMDWDEITPSMMHKTVQVAREQLGVSTVVFCTIPFSNNIVTEEDIEQMHIKNKMIRSFGRLYHQHSQKLEDMTIVHWDVAQLNNLLVQDNARRMGFDVQEQPMSSASSNDDDNNNLDFAFALETLQLSEKQRTQLAANPNKHISHTHSIGHVCAGPRVPHDSPDCIYNNMITYDGQHVCLKTMGGRLMAGLACVIRCATTYGSSSVTSTSTSTSEDAGGNAKDNLTLLYECEDACNQQYMSLKDIEESLFDNASGDGEGEDDEDTASYRM